MRGRVVTCSQYHPEYPELASPDCRGHPSGQSAIAMPGSHGIATDLWIECRDPLLAAKFTSCMAAMPRIRAITSFDSLMKTGNPFIL